MVLWGGWVQQLICSQTAKTKNKTFSLIDWFERMLLGLFHTMKPNRGKWDTIEERGAGLVTSYGAILLFFSIWCKTRLQITYILTSDRAIRSIGGEEGDMPFIDWRLRSVDEWGTRPFTKLTVPAQPITDSNQQVPETIMLPKLNHSLYHAIGYPLNWSSTAEMEATCNHRHQVCCSLKGVWVTQE